MKESYAAEAKLRRKKGTESFRDFGQAIEDLYRRAYPDNRENVQESSMKTFMDNCSDCTEDFRLAVKRTRPKTCKKLWRQLCRRNVSEWRGPKLFRKEDISSK